jgi:redox-sensitive bicupin YhaK (pirin superfamily)
MKRRMPMLRYIDGKKMGRSDLGWLNSQFHFSFAEYCNPDNVQFGVLRVLNDDTVRPGFGFDTHQHKDMEIVSYVIEGELTHADSMNNAETLTRGQVQYMSAGTGVFHSEYNRGTERLRFMQIWIIPDKKGYEPVYGSCRFEFGDRHGKWLHVASGADGGDSGAPIRVHADINIYAAMLDAGKTLDFKISPGRQAYLVLAEGEANVNDIRLAERDALEIVEESVAIAPIGQAHALVIEMAKG